MYKSFKIDKNIFMKKIKNIILIVVTGVFLTGCTSIFTVQKTASDTVEDYLQSYQNLEYQVLADMQKIVSAQSDMNDEQKEIYIEILKKQYVDLEYEIISQTYNGDSANVKVSVSVYDYFDASLKSSEYLMNNASAFYNSDNEYDVSLYMDYKLNLYKSVITKVSYEIEFNLVKENGVWMLNSVDSSVLEKLHGIYDYSSD